MFVSRFFGSVYRFGTPALPGLRALAAAEAFPMPDLRERTAPFSSGRFYVNEQHPSVYRSVARRNTKECHALCRVRSFGTAECEHAELARLR